MIPTKHKQDINDDILLAGDRALASQWSLDDWLTLPASSRGWMEIEESLRSCIQKLICQTF